MYKVFIVMGKNPHYIVHSRRLNEPKMNSSESVMAVV